MSWWDSSKIDLDLKTYSEYIQDSMILPIQCKLNRNRVSESNIKGSNKLPFLKVIIPEMDTLS